MKLWVPISLTVASMLVASAIWLTPARSDTGQTSQCGPASVGATATAIVFPVSGGTGPAVPHNSVVIQAPTTGYLCVNPVGGTAATSGSGCAAGSLYTAALGTPLTLTNPAPVSISVVASAPATPMTCVYQ